MQCPLLAICEACSPKVTMPPQHWSLTTHKEACLYNDCKYSAIPLNHSLETPTVCALPIQNRILLALSDNKCAAKVQAHLETWTLPLLCRGNSGKLAPNKPFKAHMCYLFPTTALSKGDVGIQWSKKRRKSCFYATKFPLKLTEGVPSKQER